jgi:hypothetical protein
MNNAHTNVSGKHTASNSTLRLEVSYSSEFWLLNYQDDGIFIRTAAQTRTLTRYIYPNCSSNLNLNDFNLLLLFLLFFIMGDSPVTEFCVPTFRSKLSVSSS